MPNNLLILGGVVGGAVVAPTDTKFTYRILSSATLADKGGLRGVISEPMFTEAINAGAGTLALQLDHYPAELTYGDIIRVNYPDGSVAGMWKHEGLSSKLAATNSFGLTLVPLVAELTDADYNANWTTDNTQPTPPLGTTTIDVPVRAGIARTLHCSAGVLLNDGNLYGYAYNNATAKNPLEQAVLFAGSGWWWRCDSMGEVTLRNWSPYTHIINAGRELIAGAWDEDIHSLFNGQPVTGGQPANSTVSLTAFAADTNPGNPFSIPNLGRRTAQPYSDTSILDQFSLNAIAASLLNSNERVSRSRKLQLDNYTVRRPRPGDAIKLRVADPDGPDAGNVSIVGPFLITAVTEHGATNCFDVTVAAGMVVPTAAMQPTLSAEQAIAKLISNNVRSAVSPDGTTGTVLPSVITQTSVAPPVPVGLSAVTGLDRIAQTNNAYAYLTWSAPSTSDAVTGWDVRWRKPGDTQFYTLHVGTEAVKIGALIQGFGYAFSIRAQNASGNLSAWTAEISVTMQQDAAAPAIPSGLQAVRTPRGALVTWQGNAEADLQGYLLQVSVGGSGFAAVNAAPSLLTSYAYTAPPGTPIGTVLVFQVAAVDWSGNQSAFSQASANTTTDGIVFDEIMTGNLTATGTVQGGTLQTAASGARVVLDNSGLRMYDGTVNDHGYGPGITADMDTTTGNAFFSGTVSASRLQGVAGGVGGSGARMWQDFLSTTPGIGPLLDVNDGAVDRVQVGNLNALGASPAQYGVRVNDSTGSPIMDSLGLIGAVKLAAYTGNGTGVGSSVAGTTPIQQTGTNLPFSIANRPQYVLVILNTSLYMYGEGQNGYINVGVQSWGNSVTQQAQATLVALTTPNANVDYNYMLFPVTCILFMQLPVGSFIAAAYYSNNSAGTFNGFSTYSLTVLQMGG